MIMNSNNIDIFTLKIGEFKNKTFILLCCTPGLTLKKADLEKLHGLKKNNVEILIAISSVGIQNNALDFAKEKDILYLNLEKNGTINILTFLNKFTDIFFH